MCFFFLIKMQTLFALAWNHDLGELPPLIIVNAELTPHIYLLSILTVSVISFLEMQPWLYIIVQSLDNF